MSSPDALNQQFAIDNHLRFATGRGGLVCARVDNDLAQAEIYLHGAHVTAFVPKKEQPVLWLSEQARFETGKAIRGGIPVIFPWFGADPAGQGPQHGFARTSPWSVRRSWITDDGGTGLCLRLLDNEQSRALWPHAFDLQLYIEVGRHLRVSLVCHNTGTTPFMMGAALHSYFYVGEIGDIQVQGLEGRTFIDQLDGNRRKQQHGAVRFAGEVDRIYVDTGDDCMIHDPVLQRRIRIGKAGSRSTVIWNPWRDKARAMADFPDEGYRKMVCIETANAGPDVRRLRPGEQHELRQCISVSGMA